MEAPQPNHKVGERQAAEKKLKLRFNKAIQPGSTLKRGEKTIVATRSLGRIDTNTYLPSSLDLSDKSSSEIMVILFEKLRSFQMEKNRSSAFKALSDALRAADYLTDTLPGNDMGNEFYAECREHLGEVNPRLGKFFDKMMEEAYDRGENRRDLFKKWRQNQNRTEIVYERK